MNKAVKNLIAKIESTFAATQYPGDENIANKEHCAECEELYLQFKGKHWQDITDVAFLRRYQAGLSLFKPAGFQFYLPAYMRAALVDPATADVILDGLEFHLEVPETSGAKAKEWFRNYGTRKLDYFLNRVGGFNAEQREVILGYINLHSMLYPALSLQSKSHRERTQRYWSTGSVME